MSSTISLSNQTNLNSSLYCGDLRKEVTEANIFRIFNAVGPVSSIRVCRDAVSRESLGYAYINFVNPVDAERALDILNFTPINKKPCRLMWVEKNPEKRKLTEANLYIRNLHPTIDNKTLFDTFSMFGDILSCKIQMDDNGVSLGYGFVHYTKKSAAEKALQRVNGMEIAGKKVLVSEHRSRKDRETKKHSDDAWKSLYIKNFPLSWNEKELEELIKNSGGENFKVHISKNDDGSSKGFGFINYDDHENAVKCLDALNGKKIGDEMLYVARHRSKAERQKMTKEGYVKEKYARFQRFQGLNLYVKNLPSSCDDEQLKMLFEPFGTITSAKVMLSKGDGKSLGFGFVCFEKKEEAKAAIGGMHSRMVDNKPLFVCLAEMKEQRLSRFQSQPRRDVFRPSYGGTNNVNATGPGFSRMSPQLPMAYGAGYPGMTRGAQMIRGGPMTISRGGHMPMTRGRGQILMNKGNGIPMTRETYPMPHQQRHPMSFGQATTPIRRQLNRPGGSVGTQPTTNQELISQLALLDNAQAKQLLGEKLYGEIAKQEKDAAGKITGMLLEMDNTELIMLLEDKVALRKKIDEALFVLEKSGLNQYSAAE